MKLAQIRGKTTQKAFARSLGISGERPEERYRWYEIAEREPPLWILSAIRRATGASLDLLIADRPPGEQGPLEIAKGAEEVEWLGIFRAMDAEDRAAATRLLGGKLRRTDAA